ncbi:hypothetical protein ACFQV4_15180 [Streptomyces thermocarboxydus]
MGGIEREHLHPLVGEPLFPGVHPEGGVGGPPGPDAPLPSGCAAGASGTRSASGRASCSVCRTATRNSGASVPCARSAAPSPDASPWSRPGRRGGPLPKALQAQRGDLFLRAQHGDTDGVLQLLDMGVDCRVRDAAAVPSCTC